MEVTGQLIGLALVGINPRKLVMTDVRMRHLYALLLKCYRKNSGELARNGRSLVENLAKCSVANSQEKEGHVVLSCRSGRQS